MSGMDLLAGWAFGAPGFAAQPGGDGAMAAMELPKLLQRASETSLYSTCKLGASYAGIAATALANQSNPVFTTALDSDGQGFTPLTLGETNLPESGRISSGAAYGVYGISALIYNVSTNGAASALSPTATDLWNVITNGMLRWQMLQTTIDICPLHLAGAGGGVYGSTADTGGGWGGTNGSQVSLNNGAGAVWVYQFLPVLLSASTTFRVNIVFGASAIPINLNAEANTALACKISLMGTYRTALPVG